MLMLLLFIQLAIKQLIMERFDVCAAQKGIQTASETPATSASTTNGHGKDHDSVTPVEPSSPAQSSMSQKRQAESEEHSDTSSKTPPVKKQKPDNDIDADALFAAKLQAEENMRARQTRGASTRRSQPVKKKQPAKAKTSKKVKAEDDSDLESGSDSGKKVNRSGGFHVCCKYFLLEVTGADGCLETADSFPGTFGFVGWRGDGMTISSHFRSGKNYY